MEITPLLLFYVFNIKPQSATRCSADNRNTHDGQEVSCLSCSWEINIGKLCKWGRPYMEKVFALHLLSNRRRWRQHVIDDVLSSAVHWIKMKPILGQSKRSTLQATPTEAPVTALQQVTSLGAGEFCLTVLQVYLAPPPHSHKPIGLVCDTWNWICLLLLLMMMMR